MAACDFQRHKKRASGTRGLGDRVKKMNEGGYMTVKFGGMRNDLGFSVSVVNRDKRCDEINISKTMCIGN